MAETIHDDVERALTAFGGGHFSYRTFGTFAIHPRTPIVVAPPPPEPEPVHVAAPEPPPAEVVAAPEPPPRMEPAFGPAPVPPPAAAAPQYPSPQPPPQPPLQPAYQPGPPGPGYAAALVCALSHDPYFGPVPGVGGPGYPTPGYPTPGYPGHDPRGRAGQPIPPPLGAGLGQPVAPRRAGEMNIFQLAWDSTAAAADGTDRAGPRQAAKDAPLPGDDDLFRRI